MVQAFEYGHKGGKMICINANTIIQFTVFLIYFIFALAVFNGGIVKMKQRILLFSFLAVYALDSLMKVLLFNTCSDLNTAQFAMFVSAPCWMADTPIIFLLALDFNRKSRPMSNRHLYITMIFYVILFTTLSWAGLVQHVDHVKYGWRAAPFGVWGFIYSVIDDFFILGSLVLIAGQAFGERPGLRKKQGFTILASSFITVAFVFCLRFIRGLENLPVTSNIIVLFVILGIYIANRFYGFVEITPAFAASAVFNTTSEMMLLVEPDGTIVKANRAFAEKTNIPESGLEGMNISGLLEGGDATFEALKNAGEKAPAIMEVGVNTGSGTMACLANTAFLKKSGVIAGAAVVLSDITEIKKAQDELRSYRDRLEAMVDERTQELDSANIKLQQKAKTAEEFTKASYHDLMEPVSSISRMLGFIRARNLGKLDHGTLQNIDDVIFYAARMQGLIKDMRDYINVDYLAGDGGSGDPGTAFGEVASGMEGKAEFKYGPMPRVKCQQTLLKEIFQRLADNSVKFNPKEGLKIWLSCEVREATVEFVFEDNGIGVDEAYAEKIFEVFEKLHGHREYPGNGIGLAICRRIVETHHGRMWAEQSSRGGLAIKFTMLAAGQAAGGPKPV
jgi:PAS domain S-box-containing protein